MPSRLLDKKYMLYKLYALGLRGWSIWVSQITTGSLVNLAVLEDLKYREPEFLRFWNVWKIGHLFLWKKVKCAPQHWDRLTILTRLGAMSCSWASHVYTTEMICGCVEKAGFGGHSTQVTSLGNYCDPVHCWRSPDRRFIESVTQSSTKKILQISLHRTVTNHPTHSWLNQDQKLVTSILQKLAVPKWHEGVATI
jgi:hypothetical protein